MATPRKAAPKKDTEITEPQVVENDVDTDADTPEVEKSPAKIETEAEDQDDDALPTFTVEINGEEVELEDRWLRRDAAPAALMLLGKAEYAQKYAPAVLESIIEEDQMMTLFEAGASTDELGNVIRAWSKARGLGKL